METMEQITATDSQLIEAAARGHSNAIQEIVKRHQAMVHRTCLRVLRNQADAEDATQATFIVFLKKCEKLKRGTVLGGWLYRTAELVCREFIRSSRRQKRREEDTATMKKTTFQSNTEIWSSVQPELDAAITTLPQKYRDVVVLRYLEGKSTNETAVAMGMSDSAVTTCLARGMERLRTWFQRRGVEVSAAALTVALAENATAATVPASVVPSTITAAGSGAAVGSAMSEHMANAALVKMNSALWFLFDTWMFIGWIATTATWVREGCSIPRWVHILAICLFGTGVISTVALGIVDILTPLIAAMCILIPPAAAYVGWLWMFGPSHAKSEK